MKTKEKKPSIAALKKAQNALSDLYGKEPNEELVKALSYAQSSKIKSVVERLISRRFLPVIR